MGKWYKKPVEANYIDVDKKFNSVVSEYKRILKFDQELMLSIRSDSSKELFESLNNMIKEIYFLEDSIILNENFNFSVSMQNQEYNFLVSKLHKNERMINITISNESNGQFFWTTYGTSITSKGRPIFKYTEVAKIQQSLDAADPKSKMIKRAFRKSATLRADKYLEIMERHLKNIKESHKTNSI